MSPWSHLSTSEHLILDKICPISHHCYSGGLDPTFVLRAHPNREPYIRIYHMQDDKKKRRSIYQQEWTRTTTNNTMTRSKRGLGNNATSPYAKVLQRMTTINKGRGVTISLAEAPNPHPIPIQHSNVHNKYQKHSYFRSIITDGRTNKASYRVAYPKLKN